MKPSPGQQRVVWGLAALLTASPLLAGAILPPDFTPRPRGSPEARAFLRALDDPQATPEQRRSAWEALVKDGQPSSKAVVKAVEKARRRAWARLDDLIRSAAVREAASGLHRAIAPQQPAALEAIRGGGFGKPKLDQAMKPIEEALDEAIQPLRDGEPFKPLRETIGELEGYAVGCGLRHGWTEELLDILVTLRFVVRYAGKPSWLETVDANHRYGSWIGPGEHACIARLNTHRILLGVGPAEIDLRLVVAAKKHSEEMVAKRYFSHSSPTPALKSPWARAGREHTRSHGECIAGGGSSGVGAFRMWYYSQGHHKIMITGSAIGVGRCNGRWTLMVGGSRMRGTTASRMATYVRRRYEARDAAAKLFELARWCADSGLLTQAEDELARVVQLDPKHEQAQKALERLRGRADGS